MIPSGQGATLLSANSTAFSLFMVVGFLVFGALAELMGLALTAKLASIAGGAALLATRLLWRASAANDESNMRHDRCMCGHRVG